MQEAQFVVRGGGLGQADLLGLWRQAPSSGGVSFAAGADDEDEEIVWSIALPADPGLARRQMAEQAQAVRETKASVHQAGVQLRQIQPGRPGDAVSFAAGADEPVVSAAEAQLLANVDALRGVAPGDESATTFAISLGPLKVPDGLEDAVTEFREFMDSSVKLLRPTLRVETQQGGIVTGFSLVGIDGDNDTCWQGVPDLAAMALHRDSINLSLQSRLALLQLIAQVTVGAAGLATKFAIPGGAIAALPAAYRYLRDVVEQARKFNQLQSQRQ